MNTAPHHDHPCDTCGSTASEPIPVAPLYMGGQDLHVCRDCGSVYVKSRRTAEAIADAWSRELFGGHYNARIPAIIARLTYVAEFLDTRLGLAGREVADIGAGEGQFLDMIRQPRMGARVFGVEPSAENCARLAQMGIANFQGPVEAYAASQAQTDRERFDIVTIMWTLEATAEPRVMLNAAWDILKPGGQVLIATGSRILAPFKKPLWAYLSAVPADTHPLRLSANTLGGILANTGFRTSHVNSWIDSDVLVMTAEKRPRGEAIAWQRDDWRQVVDFFRRWHEETQAHYPRPA